MCNGVGGDSTSGDSRPCHRLTVCLETSLPLDELVWYIIQTRVQSRFNWAVSKSEHHYKHGNMVSNISLGRS